MNPRCLVQCFIGSFIGLAGCVDTPKSLFSDVEALSDPPASPTPSDPPADPTPSGGGLMDPPSTATPGPEAENRAEPPGDDRFVAPFPDESECEVPLELLANDGGEGSAFAVPLEDDHYECFYFRAPTEPTLSLGFSPIIGDSRVVHHGLLYAANDAGFSDGAHEDCTGSHPDATLLAAWAPSGLPYGLPPGVGLQLPSGEDAFFILEIHYTNLARHQGAEDRSGVRVCGTREPQPNIAAVHWLGTEDISLPPGTSEAGTTCAPDLDEPVNILSVTPHLHQLGARSRMVINRGDGSEQVLFDEPFDFNAQVGYDTPAVLLPGDSITASCRWNNTTGGPTSFGEGTEDEMCYLFTLAYPAGALDTGGNFFGLRRSGENKCMN